MDQLPDCLCTSPTLDQPTTIEIDIFMLRTVHWCLSGGPVKATVELLECTTISVHYNALFPGYSWIVIFSTCANNGSKQHHLCMQSAFVASLHSTHSALVHAFSTRTRIQYSYTHWAFVHALSIRGVTPLHAFGISRDTWWLFLLHNVFKVHAMYTDKTPHKLRKNILLAFCVGTQFSS